MSRKLFSSWWSAICIQVVTNIRYTDKQVHSLEKLYELVCFSVDLFIILSSGVFHFFASALNQSRSKIICKEDTGPFKNLSIIFDGGGTNFWLNVSWSLHSSIIAAFEAVSRQTFINKYCKQAIRAEDKSLKFEICCKIASNGTGFI